MPNPYSFHLRHMASLSLSFPVCKVSINDGVRPAWAAVTRGQALLPFPSFLKKRPTGLPETLF